MMNKTLITLATLASYFSKLLKRTPDFHGKVTVNFNNGNIPSLKITTEQSILLKEETTE